MRTDDEIIARINAIGNEDLLGTRLAVSLRAAIARATGEQS